MLQAAKVRIAISVAVAHVLTVASAGFDTSCRFSLCNLSPAAALKLSVADCVCR
jgi:hypothetical protein